MHVDECTQRATTRALAHAHVREVYKLSFSLSLSVSVYFFPSLSLSLSPSFSPLSLSIETRFIYIVSSSSQKWSEVEATHSFPQQVFPTPPRVTPTSFCGSNSTVGWGDRGIVRFRWGARGVLEALRSDGLLYNSKTIETTAQWCNSVVPNYCDIFFDW